MNQLEGLGLSNYRSIGEKPVLLYPFSKVNLFVGPNNCGKSNLLRFLKKWCDNKTEFSADDYPKYDQTKKNTVYRPVHIEETLKLRTPNYSYHVSVIDELRKLIASDLFRYDKKNKIIWYSGVPEGQVFDSSFINPEAIRRFALDYVGSSSSQGVNANIRKILEIFFETISRSFPTIEKCIYIKANRDLLDKTGNDFLNEKIIDKLNHTINHNASDTQAEDDKQHFERFISDFLGYPVRVSVPASLDSINLISVDNPKEQYSLDQLGSGIHEIIYFALVATLNHGCHICIDEPEIHMHPKLQREFLEYLLENTDNQYFIATHSSAFINTKNKDVSVFKVSQNKEGFTECSFVSRMDELASLVDSLGCKASDIIQSNCVIWVEGPSDRIYLNYWIHGIDPELTEGIDYSIMFYGGRLLKHLTGENDSSDESFINLLRINKNSFVVIDSDRGKENDEISPSKKRIQKEFGNNCWITDGREIENYLNHSQYMTVAKEMDQSFVIKSGIYKKLLAKDKQSLDKVAFARRIVDEFPDPDYSVLNLLERIQGLVGFVKNCN